MNQPNKERFKTSVGGQALMEGIMMRGPKTSAVLSASLMEPLRPRSSPPPTHGVWTKIPLVRGAISMIESLIMGYKYMMYSAQVSMGDDYDPAEEETAFEKWVGDHLGKKAEDIMLAAAAVIGGLFAILLFTVLPTVLVGGLNHLVPLGRWAKVVLEAVLKVAIFLTYMAAISRMKEIHRVFEYHGAEHKTIACYEAGDPLTVENVRKYTRFHPPVRHQLFDFGGHRQRVPVQRAALVQHQPAGGVQTAAPAAGHGHQLRAAQVVRPVGQYCHPHHPAARHLGAASDRV